MPTPSRFGPTIPQGVGVPGLPLAQPDLDSPTGPIRGDSQALEAGLVDVLTQGFLTDPTKTWDTDQWAGYGFRLKGGANDGVMGFVASNTGRVLVFTTPLPNTVEVPANTAYEILTFKMPVDRTVQVLEQIAGTLQEGLLLMRQMRNGMVLLLGALGEDTDLEDTEDDEGGS